MTTPPNLLPFDLEKAKAGAKVVTKDKIRVTLLAFNARGVQPICGIIHLDHKDELERWTIKGTFFDSGNPTSSDLFLLPEVKYVPWTMEDVPLGAWFRYAPSAERGGIRPYEINVSGIKFTEDGMTWLWAELFEKWLYTTTTLAADQWHECRREVRE